MGREIFSIYLRIILILLMKAFRSFSVKRHEGFETNWSEEIKSSLEGEMELNHSDAHISARPPLDP